MKKLLFLICLGMLFLPDLAESSQISPGVSFGFRSGINFSIFTGEDSEYTLDLDFADIASAKPLIRYTGALYLNIPLSEIYSLQPELIYSQKGARWSESGDTQINNQQWEWKMSLVYELDYLEVPLLLKQKVSDHGYGYFGPQMGIILRGQSCYKWELTHKIDGNLESEEEYSRRKDIKKNMNQLDFALAAGGSLEFKHLVFDGRFTYSLVSIKDSRFDDVRNSVLAVTAGLKF